MMMGLQEDVIMREEGMNEERVRREWKEKRFANRRGRGMRRCENFGRMCLFVDNEEER